jgi:hypothetical protein
MSTEAQTVLNQLRAGSVLVGSFGDYGRPFRLERDGTAENDVSLSIVHELLERGNITRVADRGSGQAEYAALPTYTFWAVVCKRCRTLLPLKYSEEVFENQPHSRPSMASMHLICECGHADQYVRDNLMLTKQYRASPPTDFVDRI